mmetsp:Transcript_1068/g.2567  ORF Transcript_1068/g.2567 Transcript_1068/m.2567 type:complete len:316 (+) Transcript_1068:135-1082(+)
MPSRQGWAARDSCLAALLVPFLSAVARQAWQGRGWARKVAQAVREERAAALVAGSGGRQRTAGGFGPDELVRLHNGTLVASLQASGRISAEGVPDLVFVHIPKTGGTAIKWTFAPLYPFGMSMTTNSALQSTLGAEGASFEKCWFEQAPPASVAGLFGKRFEQFYRQRHVFCAVRNPYDRIVSEYCYIVRHLGLHHEETPAGLSSFVETELSQFHLGDYFRISCFFIPQSDFLRGPGGCTHLLDFDHLERDFGRLMSTQGYNLTLRPRRREGRPCRLTLGDLRPRALRLIAAVYDQDFRELGPRFGWALRPEGDR